MSKPIKPVIQQVPYSQGPEGSTVQFLLECKNVPEGSYVRFFSDDNGPEPLINLEATKVTSNSLFIIGTKNKIPREFFTTITWSLTSFVELPEDYSVVLKAAIIVDAFEATNNTIPAKDFFTQGLPEGVSPDSQVLVKELGKPEIQYA